MKIIEENPIGTRPSWDETFMSIAINNSTRSSCWFVRSGTSIVQNNQLVASGYNGASGRYTQNCLELGCAKENKGFGYEESLNSGNCIGIHSEMNATGHLSKMNSNKMTLYTTVFPCSNCAKNLEPYPIERIVFKKKYHNEEFNRTLKRLEDLGIEVYQLDLSLKRYWDIDTHRKWKSMDVWSEEEFDKARKIINTWEDLFK
ncbi:MAG: deoxycytidylate deaminase [Nanobdellota archaeon]